MSDRALQAGVGRVRIGLLMSPELEEMSSFIADSIEWGQVQAAAQRANTLPAWCATYAGDDRVRQAFREWCGSPTVALMCEGLLVAAIDIEATNPRYVELPTVLALLSSDVDFLAARPLGRFIYRQAQYGVTDSGEVMYFPEPFSLEKVLEAVNSMICPSDRVVALSMPLGLRVGLAVGFLSALSVAQPDEAQAAMVILAGLVVPLLPRKVSQAGGSARRIAPAKGKGGRKSSRQVSKRR